MKTSMKKPGTGAARGLKVPSAYKSREAEAKPEAARGAFRKAFGKAKDTARKA